MTRGLLSVSSRWLVLTLLASLMWVSHSSAVAEPRPDVVNPEWVPSDAEWVLHVNFEALAKSELMTALCGEEAGSAAIVFSTGRTWPGAACSCWM